MAFPYEIKDRLVAQGVGVYGTNIFISTKAVIPSTGDGPWLTIIETGGSGSAKTQNNTATQRPTGQITVQGGLSSTTRQMCVDAFNALGGVNGLYNITLSGTPYLSVTARQNVTDIGVGDAGRARFAFNIDAEKGPS